MQTISLHPQSYGGLHSSVQGVPLQFGAYFLFIASVGWQQLATAQSSSTSQADLSVSQKAWAENENRIKNRIEFIP